MSTLIAGIMLLAAILLVAVVFIQNSKGGGISSEFGGASQLGGVQRTTNFVEKATWGFATVIAVCAIVLTSMQNSELKKLRNQNQTETPAK
jgi:preprotein translocase subunit SecG